MSWEALEKAKEENVGVFLKIKDGEDVIGVFAGEPRTFYKDFDSKKEYPRKARGLNFRFQINFLVKEDGQYVAKILEQGSRFASSVLDVKAEYGLDCFFKIKRTGSGQDDTRYSILFKEKLSPQDLAEIKKVKLNDLGNIPTVTSSEFDDDAPPPDEPPGWMR